MPELATAIAVHKDIFVVAFAAHLADLVIIVLIRYFEEHGRFDISDLSSVLDSVRGYDIACTIVLA